MFPQEGRCVLDVLEYGRNKKSPTMLVCFISTQGMLERSGITCRIKHQWNGSSRRPITECSNSQSEIAMGTR